MRWDFENRLSAAYDAQAQDEINYRWDATGRRVCRLDGENQKIRVYIHDGQQVIADYSWGQSPTATEYRYVYGDYVDEPILRLSTANKGRLYYHRDQQYSVVALSNSSGAAVERYGYDAYGTVAIFSGGGTARTTSSYGNRYTYTGREWDADLKLYHYRARMYDGNRSRFGARLLKN